MNRWGLCAVVTYTIVASGCAHAQEVSCPAPPPELLQCSVQRDCGELPIAVNCPRGDSACEALKLRMQTSLSAQKGQCESENAKQKEDCEAINTGLKAAANRCDASRPPPTTGSLWVIDGSLVSLTGDGENRRFIYHTPRAGLSAIGVRPGMVLFDGKRSGTGYSGKYYTFSKTCGAQSQTFDVSGPISSDDRQVTLYGQAQLIDPVTCKPSGSRNEVHVLTYENTPSAESTPRP
jgi:hypothetical protein